MLTDEDRDAIASAVADKVIDELERPEVIIHIMEHQAVGGGRVIDAERARATPCKCFEHESETYAWSPGVLGLISSKKNPEQMTEFCSVCLPAQPGVQERFAEMKEAIGEAHKRWEEKGGGLPSWWEEVGKSLAKRGIEL